MQKIIRITIFIPILLLLSCVSESKLIEIEPPYRSKVSPENFNGNYRNLQDSTSKRLWNSLYDCYSFRRSKKPVPDNAIINLTLSDDYILSVKAYNEDGIIDEIELEVVVEDDYLSIKKKLRLIPIPFFWIHNETKVILGNDKKKDLIVKTGEHNGGWILIMAGGGVTFLFSNNYSKLDN